MAEIVTLTPSPAVDLSTSVARLDPDHKLRCAAPRRDPGGGGINVARVIHRLGGKVTAVYPAGGPSGDLLTRLLREEGVPTHPVRASGDTRENFYVLETSTGRQFKFILPGPVLGPKEEAAPDSGGTGIPLLNVLKRGGDWREVLPQQTSGQEQ